MEKLIDLNEFTNVVGYSYRKARVFGGVTIAPPIEEYDRFQRELCAKSGIKPDNHTVFQVGSIAVMFSDCKIIVSSSTNVEVGNW